MLPQNPHILDMACGNGRATVDLRKRVTSHVTGFDIDSRMLDAAKRLSQARKLDILYVQGDVKTAVSTVPGQQGAFAPESFDGVAIASAIHWVLKANAADNVHMLLKPDGKLFILSGRMGKNDPPRPLLGRNGPQEIISKALGRRIEFEDPDGEEELRKHGFECVDKQDFKAMEEYAFDEACAQVKSTGWYAELSKADKEKAWPALEAALKEKFINGTNVSLRVEQICRCYAYKPV
jgi:ubiquinone/menaquinone biosynthesis C-methylase UbiE